MLRRTGLASVLCLFSLTAASALDLGLYPYIEAGSGQASGSFLSGRGDFYSELGASSITQLGSSAPYYPILLGGLGVDLSLSGGDFLLWNGPFSFVTGMDVGSWGGAVSGKTAADGTAFASTRARDIAFSIHVGERYRIALEPKGILSFDLGPFVGFNCAYFVQENISGIYSLSVLSPDLADLAFVGVGLGCDYGYELGPGLLTLGLRGDIALTPIASADGVVGGSIEYPWRVLVRAGYEIPLGQKKAKK
jgi:hypothetical protein